MYEGGRSKTVLTMLKMATADPIPSARSRITTTEESPQTERIRSINPGRTISEEFNRQSSGVMDLFFQESNLEPQDEYAGADHRRETRSGPTSTGSETITLYYSDTSAI